MGALQQAASTSCPDKLPDWHISGYGAITLREGARTLQHRCSCYAVLLQHPWARGLGMPSRLATNTVLCPPGRRRCWRGRHAAPSSGSPSWRPALPPARRGSKQRPESGSSDTRQQGEQARLQGGRRVQGATAQLWNTNMVHQKDLLNMCTSASRRRPTPSRHVQGATAQQHKQGSCASKTSSQRSPPLAGAGPRPIAACRAPRQGWTGSTRGCGAPPCTAEETEEKSRGS